MEEKPEFAEQYTLRERVRLALIGMAIAAVLISFNLWFQPAWAEFAASAHCRQVLGVSGVAIVFYGLFVVMPLLGALILGVFSIPYGLGILRDGQDPPIGSKVLRPTRIRREASARRRAYVQLLAPAPFVIIAIWGTFQAHSLVASASERHPQPRCQAPVA